MEMWTVVGYVALASLFLVPLGYVLIREGTRGCRQVLFWCAVLGIPIALSVGIAMGTRYWFNWPSWVGTTLGIAFLVALIASFRWWALWKRRKELRSVGEMDDPVFGHVTRMSDSWESEIDFMPLRAKVIVSGIGGNLPTDVQKRTFRDVQDHWLKWVGEINEALDRVEYVNVSGRSRKLKFESILISAHEPGWSLTFEVVDSDAPWGFEADFKDGRLVDLEQLH